MPNSSMVEQSAVNRPVIGSSPILAVGFIFTFKEILMKNFIVALMLLISGTTVASANCSTGTCGRPVLSATKTVVTTPVRVARRVVTLPSRVRASRCR